MSSPKVVIYRYSQSPFARKIENLLALRNIPYSQVDVPMVPPRGALLALGISYRRIPVVAIDGDVYINTPFIAQALERAFPPSDKHPTIFPGRDAQLQLLWSSSYADKELFQLGGQSLPWSKLPLSFAKDRIAGLAGGPTPTPELLKQLDQRFPATRSAIVTHLDKFEQHLSDGREWLFSTSTPSYADLSAHMSLSWVRSMATVNEAFDKAAFPKTLAWLDRFTAVLEQAKKATPVTTIKSAQAVQEILSAPQAQSEGFEEIDAQRLGLNRGVPVTVTPDDTGKIPTTGTLVGLTRREIVIEVAPPGGRKLAVHFPRSGFVVKPDSKPQSKL